MHFAGCCFLLIHWMDFQTSKSILVRIFTKIFPSHQTLAYSLPAIFGSNNMFYTSVHAVWSQHMHMCLCGVSAMQWELICSSYFLLHHTHSALGCGIFACAVHLQCSAKKSHTNSMVGHMHGGQG